MNTVLNDLLLLRGEGAVDEVERRRPICDLFVCWFLKKCVEHCVVFLCGVAEECVLTCLCVIFLERCYACAIVHVCYSCSDACSACGAKSSVFCVC